LEWDGGGNH
jgi:hypothetical protein